MMKEYIFNPETLEPKNRRDGISAFLRVRNGEDFLRIAIESHIHYFDEIVAVYNQCTDNTPEILHDLAKKYPIKIKIYEYKPRVYPPGSDGHKITPPDSVHSLVNYYNYALSKTTFKIATKLDADHLAIQSNLKKTVDYIRKNGLKDKRLSFSGINLMQSKEGEIGVFSNKPFSGNDDICFFPVSKSTYFIHDPRYAYSQGFHPGNLNCEYAGILYFHLKYLMKNYGFENYELHDNPNSRYAPRLEFFKKHAEYQSLEEFVASRSVRCDLSPSQSQKAKIIEKIPLSFLRLFMNLPIVRKSLYLSRALRLKDDMEGVALPKELLELTNE